MADSMEQFLDIIDNRIEKHLNFNTSSYIKQRLAKVIEVDTDSQKVYVYFVDDENQTQYVYYNKTNEIITSGDNVKVFYTSDIIKGWIGARCGDPVKNDILPLEPIVSITINSDIDYTVLTNSGKERYIGILEETV